MKIALDIDGVLADFVTPFLQLLERRVGGPSIDPASITDPNFQHHPFLTKELIYDCMVDTSYDASSGACSRRCRRRTSGKRSTR
jgi:hypothetical protein